MQCFSYGVLLRMVPPYLLYGILSIFVCANFHMTMFYSTVSHCVHGGSSSRHAPTQSCTLSTTVCSRPLIVSTFFFYMLVYYHFYNFAHCITFFFSLIFSSLSAIRNQFFVTLVFPIPQIIRTTSNPSFHQDYCILLSSSLVYSIKENCGLLTRCTACALSTILDVH
jgi:hypothetical protein